MPGHTLISNEENIRSRLETLKAEKGRLTREVGEAKKVGNDCTALIEQLKSISNEYKVLSKAYKRSLNAELVDTSAESSPSEALSRIFDSRTPQESHKLPARIVCDVREGKLMEAWDRLVMRHPQASPYHLMAFRDAIERTYGHATQYLCAVDAQDEVIALLPLVQLKSRLFGNFVVSMPYFNYGGLLAGNRETARQLIQAAGEWANSVGAKHTELRHLSDSGLELPKRTEKVSFWLPLPSDPDELWASFKPKIRAQIKRPLSESPRIQFGQLELLDHFYEVFAQNMRDLGTPVYGKSFFKSVLSAMGASAWIVVVYLGSKPVGCAFLLGFRDRMEIPWASTLRSTNALGINMFMYWEVLRFSINQGYKIFDFGRCSEDSGTYRFKQQWGAQPVPLVWEYKIAEGETMPQLNPHNPKFRLLIALWQRMPVWMTRILGPSIVKSLP